MIDRIGSGARLYFSGPAALAARAYDEAERLGLLVHSPRTHEGIGSFVVVLTHDLAWGQFTRLIDLLSETGLRDDSQQGAAAGAGAGTRP